MGGAGAGEAGTAALTDRTNPSPSETTVVETDAAPNVSAGSTRGDGSPEIAAAPAAASSLASASETRAARGAGGDETPGTLAIELDPEVNEADLVEALEAIDLADATQVGDTTDAGASTVSQKAQRDDGPAEMRILEDRAGGPEEEERNVDDGHDGTRAPVFLELFGGANEDKLNVRLVEVSFSRGVSPRETCARPEVTQAHLFSSENPFSLLAAPGYRVVSATWPPSRSGVILTES